MDILSLSLSLLCFALLFYFLLPPIEIQCKTDRSRPGEQQKYSNKMLVDVSRTQRSSERLSLFCFSLRDLVFRHHPSDHHPEWLLLFCSSSSSFLSKEALPRGLLLLGKTGTFGFKTGVLGAVSPSPRHNNILLLHPLTLAMGLYIISFPHSPMLQ